MVCFFGVSFKLSSFNCSGVPLDKEGGTVPIVQSTRVDHAGRASCCIIVVPMGGCRTIRVQGGELFLPVVSPGCDGLDDNIFSPEGKYAKDDRLPDRSIHDVFDHSS